MAVMALAGPLMVQCQGADAHRPAHSAERTGPDQANQRITREDTQRFITIQNNVVGRDIGSFVADAQAAIDREVQLPAGYFTTWGGSFRLQQEANKRLPCAFGRC